jgi:uncharacterized RDD family membrane protein YckC
MQYEDRVTIATPEGVTLELTLAGLGSRLVGAIVDGLVVGVSLAGIGLILVLAAELLVDGGIEAAPLLVMAVYWIISFLVVFGYDVCFEVLNSGRTIGKRAAGLRVVRLDGGPVMFRTSAVRNLLRLIDWFPFFAPLTGIICILVTGRNQRVGDLVAGTLVVREPRAARRGQPFTPIPEVAAARHYTGPPPPAYTGGRPAQAYATSSRRDSERDYELSTWDVSAVTVDELATVRRFLDRRNALDVHARRRLAVQLVERLAPKVAGAPTNLPTETFLELLAQAKSARS